MTSLLGNLDGEIEQSISKFVKEMWSIWEDIGLSKEQTDIKSKNIVSSISGMMDNILKDEYLKKDELLNTFNSTMERVNKLVADLEIPPFVLTETKNVLAALDELVRDEQALERRKVARIKEYEDLKNSEKAVCDVLKEEKMVPKSFEINPVPKLAFLDKYRLHIQKLQEIKNARHTDAVQLLENIKSITNKLGITIEEPILRNAMIDINTLILTENNISLLRKVSKECHEDLSKSVKQFDELRNYVKVLASRLNVKSDNLENFTKSHSEFSKRNLDALKQKASELEGVRNTNIDSYLERMRNELEKVAADAWLGSEQKKRLLGFPCLKDSPTVLEDKINLAHKLLKERRTVLETIKVILETQSEISVLEKKSLDPKRLNNRGACLLQFEKENNRLSRLIARLNKDLRFAVNEYELKHKSKFLIFDHTIENFITGKCDSYPS